MSSSHSRSRSSAPGSQPMLRLFSSEGGGDDPAPVWTVRRAFEELILPRSRAKKKSELRRSLALWEEFEQDWLATQAAQIPPDNGPPIERAQRFLYPMSCAEVTTEVLQQCQEWMLERYSASTTNRVVGQAYRCVVAAAKRSPIDHEVCPPKKLYVSARPRYYISEEMIGQLWEQAEGMRWPERESKPRKGDTFAGTGMEPADWWRCVLVIMRSYGMRVQDFVAYDKDKRPMTWSADYRHPESPNPESLERWPLGWLHFMAQKTAHSSARVYTLPVMPAARVALDRLREAASARGACGPQDKLICCPMGGTFSKKWHILQARAKVESRDGKFFQMEDMRKTVGNASRDVHAELPWALCGWKSGDNIQRKHYTNPEPLLVREICKMLRPACFSAWERPEDMAAVRRHVETLDDRDRAHMLW